MYECYRPTNDDSINLNDDTHTLTQDLRVEYRPLATQAPSHRLGHRGVLLPRSSRRMLIVSIMIFKIERGTTRAEIVQGTPAQSHIPASILVYEECSIRRISIAT